MRPVKSPFVMSCGRITKPLRRVIAEGRLNIGVNGSPCFTSLETSGMASPWRKELFFTGTFHAVLSMGLQICRVLIKSTIARRQVAPFISSMAALAEGGPATEELDISALYYAALEEADETVNVDEEEADDVPYLQQIEDEL